jgi:small subunit ribosomal protein S18
MPRKTHTDKKSDRRGRGRSAFSELRTPRPKPKIDFTVDALDFKNVNLLRQFVTDQGRLLPRKYTGLPAHYQRQLSRSIKRARQMLLMK